MSNVVKKKVPVFRGRFGTRSKRRKSIAKWDKWRVTRGIDIKWEKGDGQKPRIGYRNSRTVRHLHPKGAKENYVANAKALDALQKGALVRFASKIGKKKKAELVKIAEGKKLIILNK